MSEALPGTNLAAFQRRWSLTGERQPGEADVLFFVFNRRDPTELGLVAEGHGVAARGARSAGLRAGLVDRHGSDARYDTASVLPTLLPGFAGTTLPDWLAARLRAGLGGVCLFASNLESLDQLRDLTDAIYAENPRALIAIDEEGGDVTRLFAREGSPSPGNAVLGRLDDLDTTAYAAREIGLLLRRTGVNVNFAPSVDINSNPDNPVIGVRSFGDTAERVARARRRLDPRAAVHRRGRHAPSTSPGTATPALDSHLALPVIDRSPAELRERELVPFAAAIEAGVRVVMTSHILLPQLDPDQPATHEPRRSSATCCAPSWASPA